MMNIDPNARDDAKRAELFSYAQLDLQVINILVGSMKEGLDHPHRDDCLKQAGKNLLGWLNRKRD
jgi:hypothetical protein